MSAWLTLSWEPLARHRRIFGMMAVYCVLLCFVCPLLPGTWRNTELVPALLAGPCVVVVLLAASLAHGYEGRLEARASAFPRRLFTLPVSAPGLAGPPLLLGTLLGACWPIVAVAILRPCGYQTPLFWPAALIAAFLAWSQALSWSPFPLPWLRLVGLSLVLPGLVVVGVALNVRTDTEWVPGAVLLGLLAIAYVVAITGVARARRGVGTAEPVRVSQQGAALPQEKRTAFASAAQAHSWLEWRRHGRVLVLTLGLTLLWVLPCVLLSDWAIRLAQEPDVPKALPWLTSAIETFGAGWLAASQMLLLPITMAISGVDLGRVSSRRGVTPSPFLLTLPVSNRTFVRVKLWVAAQLVALVWLTIIVVVLAWAAISGRIYDMADRLLEFSGSRPAALGVLAGGLALGAAVTWLLLVGGLWGGLLGRKSLAWIPLAAGFGGWIATGIAVRWWIVYPDARPLLAACLGVLLLLKTAGVVWVARRLLARRVIGAASLIGWAAAWAALACVVGGLACRFTGAGAELFALILLTLPLATPLAAPLALDAARHQ